MVKYVEKEAKLIDLTVAENYFRKIKFIVVFNSGIVYDAYFVVVAAELPLPSSSLSNQIALLQTQQQQLEGKQLVSQPSNQAVLIGKLLETVNNAYL